MENVVGRKWYCLPRTKSSKGGVTLVNLQRQLAMIRCCAKNRSSVTPRCGRFFAIFAVLQRVGSFWKRFKSVTCLQIRVRNMRCELALQVDQCNITLKEIRTPDSRGRIWFSFEPSNKFLGLNCWRNFDCCIWLNFQIFSSVLIQVVVDWTIKSHYITCASPFKLLREFLPKPSFPKDNCPTMLRRLLR